MKGFSKLLGDDTLRDILKALPVDTILKFRDEAKKVHMRQLEVINTVLKEKGYVEPHLSPRNRGM